MCVRGIKNIVNDPEFQSFIFNRERRISQLTDDAALFERHESIKCES